jgi:acetyl/propionyl-CoA carboxylase alpha subunit
VQVLADAQGAVTHLGERECSIQRRHQKVVEESPSPALTPESRTALCEAGVAAAKAAGYRNAGTVEFLLDAAGRHYFLEMNTRLQVEHPVTEAVTGLDLVRLQLEIAAGKPLALSTAERTGRGHAFEARLYAEDPDRGDLPAAGRVLHYAPPEGPGVRFDSGIALGSSVPVFYDPLLAKLVTWGRDREEARQRLVDALKRTVVLGVATNLARLDAIAAHPAFRAGELHTGFLDEHLRETKSPPAPPLAFAAAALARLLAGRIAAAGANGSNGAGPAADPFASLGGWRLGEGA